MMPAAIRLALNGAIVERYNDSTRIVFGDGATLTAAPQETQDYTALAHALGYGTGATATLQMCHEHDLMHLWLAQLLHAPDLSRTVPFALAHGTYGQLPVWAIDGQEALCLALQRYVNTGYAGHELAALHLAGVDLGEVRRHALALRKDH